MDWTTAGDVPRGARGFGAELRLGCRGSSGAAAAESIAIVTAASLSSVQKKNETSQPAVIYPPA